MADSVAENDRRYDGQKNNKNIRININKKLKKIMDCIQITKKKQKTGVKNKKGCQIEKGKKRLPS